MCYIHVNLARFRVYPWQMEMYLRGAIIRKLKFWLSDIGNKKRMTKDVHTICLYRKHCGKGLYELVGKCESTINKKTFNIIAEELSENCRTGNISYFLLRKTKYILYAISNTEKEGVYVIINNEKK